MARKLITVLISLVLVAFSTACVDHEKQAAVADMQVVRTAVLAVPGISGGDVTVSDTGSLMSLYFTCELTSDAQSRDELLAVLDDIGRAIVDTAAPETDGVLNCTLSNDTDVVSFSDLADGAGGTFTSLRTYHDS